MGKRSRRKSQRLEKTPNGRWTRADRLSRGVGSSHYLIWATGVLLIVAAATVAWTVLKDDGPKSSATPPSESQVTAPPVENIDSIHADSVSGVPIINFPEAEFDFGTIAQGSKPSHKFVVRNTGDAPLRLISAKGT